MVLEKTLGSLLDCKEIKLLPKEGPLHSLKVGSCLTLGNELSEETQHLAMTGESPGYFFELQLDVWGFSQVSTGNSGNLSCGPREVQSPFALRGGARQCSRVVAGVSGLKMQ